MSQSEFLSRTFTLLQVVNGREVVTVKPFSREAGLTIEPKGDRFTQEEKEKLVMLATGLTQAELDELCQPDWLSLYDAAYDYYHQTGYQLAGKEQDEAEKAVVLWFSQEKVVTFKLPTLKLSKAAEHLHDDVERAVFLIANLTDLEDEQVRALPLPDYRSLVQALTCFLTKPAAFFQ